MVCGTVVKIAFFLGCGFGGFKKYSFEVGKFVKIAIIADSGACGWIVRAADDGDLRHCTKTA